MLIRITSCLYLYLVLFPNYIYSSDKKYKSVAHYFKEKEAQSKYPEYKILYKNNKWHIERTEHLMGTISKYLVDLKNGYISLTTPGGDGTYNIEFVLFRVNEHLVYIGDNSVVRPPEYGGIRFYRVYKKNWSEVTKKILPKLEPKMFIQVNQQKEKLNRILNTMIDICKKNPTHIMQKPRNCKLNIDFDIYGLFFPTYTLPRYGTEVKVKLRMSYLILDDAYFNIDLKENQKLLKKLESIIDESKTIILRWDKIKEKFIVK